MSAPAAAPAAPATPAPEAPSTPAAPQGAAPATPAVEAAQDKLEAAGGEVPEQKKGESDQDYEVRLSAALRELKHARREAQQNKIDKKAFEDMKAELEKAKNRRITKKEFVQLVKDLDAGKAQLEDDEWSALPPEVRKQLDELKADKEEREREKQEAANRAQRAKEEGIVSGRLKELAADLPLFEGRPDIHVHVLDLWYDRYHATGQKPDLDQVAAEVHDLLASTVAQALQSEGTRRFLIGKHPDLKALFGGHEAQASSPPREAQGTGRVNGHAAEPALSAQDNPKPNRPLTRFEEEEARSERIKQRALQYAAEVRAKKAEAAQKG